MTKFLEGQEAHFLARGAVGNGKEPEVVKILVVEGTRDGEQQYRIGRHVGPYANEHSTGESTLTKLEELPAIREEVRIAKERRQK